MAFRLNDSTSEGNPAWRQNLGDGADKDPIPVPDDSHGIVYEVEEEGGVRYSNEKPGRPRIGEDDVTLTPETFPYNGQEQRPTVTVKVGETLLTAGIDYMVTYPEDPVDAGTYQITVTGMGEGNNEGSYVGIVTVTYTIEEV